MSGIRNDCRNSEAFILIMIILSEGWSDFQLTASFAIWGNDSEFTPLHFVKNEFSFETFTYVRLILKQSHSIDHLCSVMLTIECEHIRLFPCQATVIQMNETTWIHTSKNQNKTWIRNAENCSQTPLQAIINWFRTSVHVSCNQQFHNTHISLLNSCDALRLKDFNRWQSFRSCLHWKHEFHSTMKREGWGIHSMRSEKSR